MDKYLLAILKLVNTIIIPDLGALTITNTETGEILFMPYLKHDDGKLSSHIAEKEGMEEIEAKNVIAKYVREIQIELDKGESYDMYQFGSFKKVDGDIIFINWGADNKSDSGNTVEIASDNNEHLSKPDIEIESLKSTIIESIAEVEEINDSKEQEPKVAQNIFEKKEMNILEKEEYSATLDKINELKEAQENKSTKNKKGAGFWMLISLLGIIVVGSIYGAMNFNEIKQHIPFLANTEESTVEEEDHLEDMKKLLGEDDSSIEETQPMEGEMEQEHDAEPIIEEAADPIPSAISSELPFCAIAGAFSSKENAERLVKTLVEQGLPANSFEARGKYMVSAQSFETKHAANSALPEIKEKVPGVWIYQRK